MSSKVLLRELKYLKDRRFTDPKCAGCGYKMTERDIATQNVQSPGSGMYECQTCLAWARVRDASRMSEMFK